MYRVNIKEKRLEKLSNTDFKSNNLLERYDIQEWIESSPEIVGEEILIIAKELILPTGSRLDLLGVDKLGKLLVLELKRDDSGKNIDWQAIKYASFCSNLLVDEIVQRFAEYLNIEEGEARSKLESFLDVEMDEVNTSQRILLIAREFHSDVISGVLWLRDYGVEIECLRLNPYLDKNDELFIKPEKIIPLPEAKDYIFKKEKKQREIKARTTAFNLGKIVETVEVQLKGVSYQLELYDSLSIRAINNETSENVPAKPILKEVNEAYGLNIPLRFKSGTEKNTRTLGKEVIKAVIDRYK